MLSLLTHASRSIPRISFNTPHVLRLKARMLGLSLPFFANSLKSATRRICFFWSSFLDNQCIYVIFPLLWFSCRPWYSSSLACGFVFNLGNLVTWYLGSLSPSPLRFWNCSLVITDQYMIIDGLFAICQISFLKCEPLVEVLPLLW